MGARLRHICGLLLVDLLRAGGGRVQHRLPDMRRLRIDQSDRESSPCCVLARKMSGDVHSRDPAAKHNQTMDVFYGAPPKYSTTRPQSICGDREDRSSEGVSSSTAAKASSLHSIFIFFRGC
jgi:hypothetical protein